MLPPPPPKKKEKRKIKKSNKIVIGSKQVGQKKKRKTKQNKNMHPNVFQGGTRLQAPYPIHDQFNCQKRIIAQCYLNVYDSEQY